MWWAVGTKYSSSGKPLHDISEGKKLGLETVSIENG
jgi:hypothetical protein